MKKEVHTKELKEKVKILVINIEAENEGFMLGPTNYTEKIVKGYDMLSCKIIKLPVFPEINLDEFENPN